MERNDERRICATGRQRKRPNLIGDHSGIRHAGTQAPVVLNEQLRATTVTRIRVEHGRFRIIQDTELRPDGADQEAFALRNCSRVTTLRNVSSWRNGGGQAGCRKS